MPIDLYYSPLSGPCRTVMLAAKALDVKLNYKTVDMRKGEHLTPEYLKYNPQHTIPTLVNDGFALPESRAIITYLANKYGKGSPLYPEDPEARARVDQRLHFDGWMYGRFRDYANPQWFSGAPADEALLKKVEEALGFLEIFLESGQFVAGTHLTLADLSIVVSVSNMSLMIDFSKYPNISAWWDKVKATAPGYQEINEEALQSFKKIVEMNKK